MSKEILTATEEAIKRIELAAQSAEEEAVLKVRKRSMEWAKVSAGFIGVAIAVLTFFGFREVFNFENRMDELTARAEEKSIEFESRFEAIDQKIEDINLVLDNRLQTNLEKINDFEGQLEYMTRLEESATAAQRRLEGAQEMFDELEGRHKTLSELSAQIEAAQNYVFEIQMIYPGNYEDLASFTDKLREEGFNVASENFLVWAVDRTEVIYYDESGEPPPQVGVVSQILEESLKEMGRKDAVVISASTTRLAPKEILIKIAPKLESSSR